MAKLSGIWTISTAKNNAGWKQRILIAGSDGHDSGHVMTIGAKLEHVQGEEFSVRPQAQNPSTNVWINSVERSSFSWDDRVGLTCTIEADDNPAAADGDFDDLVVICVADDEYLLTPHSWPRPDLTIPKDMVGRGFASRGKQSGAS